MIRARATIVPLALVAIVGLARRGGAQDMDVSGRVIDDAGTPIAGADVTFLPLPARARPRSGTKGRYRVAQAAHRAATRLPHTRTGRDGTFRCLISPSLAALAAGSGVEMAMRVAAPGHVTWMAAIGDRLEGANGQVAVLPRARGTDTPRLRIRIATAVDGAYRGFALIERAYRARPDRSVWLRELLPIDKLGEVVFDEPARMPGEVHASLPTARAEGYRVTLYVAGLASWQHTLTEGAHEVRPDRSDWPPRRVLAARGEPARTPLVATYEIAGEEVTVNFDEAEVSLLGGETPTAVQSPSGPVVVDAWDPDLAMFVESAPPAKERDREAPETDAPDTRAAAFLVVDRRRQPLFGAAVWIEDPTARGMLQDHKPYATTDPTGTARLDGLRPGAHWVLVRHPTAGEREVLLDTVRPGPVEVVLRESVASDSSSTIETQPGSLLLDLEQRAGGEEAVDVGVVQIGSRMMRRGFDERPRRVRLEGLTPGPVTVWVRVGEGPVHLIGGALATANDDPPLHPLRAPARTFTLDVRTHDGAPADGAYVSLGDAAPRGRAPFTAALLPLRRDDATGRSTLTVHMLGDLWVVVHGADDTRRDLLLSGEGAPTILAVTLPEPPPPPPKDGEGRDGEGKDGGDGKGGEGKNG